MKFLIDIIILFTSFSLFSIMLAALNLTSMNHFPPVAQFAIDGSAPLPFFIQTRVMANQIGCVWAIEHEMMNYVVSQHSQGGQGQVS